MIGQKWTLLTGLDDPNFHERHYRGWLRARLTNLYFLQ